MRASRLRYRARELPALAIAAAFLRWVVARPLDEEALDVLFDARVLLFDARVLEEARRDAVPLLDARLLVELDARLFVEDPPVRFAPEFDRD